MGLVRAPPPLIVERVGNGGCDERAAPASADTPVELADEIVRWATPITVFQRTATRDATLGGQEIKDLASLYRGIWRYASLPDLFNIARAATLSAPAELRDASFGGEYDGEEADFCRNISRTDFHGNALRGTGFCAATNQSDRLSTH